MFMSSSPKAGNVFCDKRIDKIVLNFASSFALTSNSCRVVLTCVTVSTTSLKSLTRCSLNNTNEKWHKSISGHFTNFEGQPHKSSVHENKL